MTATIPAAAPSVSGEVLLVEAFWTRVRANLADPQERREVVRWVLGQDKTEGRGFQFWCELSGTDAPTAREFLMHRYPEAFAA